VLLGVDIDGSGLRQSCGHENQGTDNSSKRRRRKWLRFPRSFGNVHKAFAPLSAAICFDLAAFLKGFLGHLGRQDVPTDSSAHSANPAA
jgi:hypothetical protein